RTKVREIVDLGSAGLAVLFDDMPGNLDSLGARQAEICCDIAHWVGRDDFSLRVCPTYYSDDPILDELFGPRPDNYLTSLFDDLDGAYELFWTGPAVCATSINAEALNAVSLQCDGQVAIWDNYPVNDSRARSPHIYMQGLQGRAPEIGRLIGSHWCNAMNQPALSLPALSSLPALYERQAAGVDAVLLEAGADQELIQSCLPLATRSLDELTAAEVDALNLAASGSTMAALELRDWLSGAYEFDPECLTC
uniref:beta-N-acetylglucosaminidase domain-containing protein n=1 Tax=Congregibacter sp. TaxID=2744308 RepID=UPI003F6B696F